MRQDDYSGTWWGTSPSSRLPIVGTGSSIESPTTRLSEGLQEGGSGHQAWNSAEPYPPLWTGQRCGGTWVWPALRPACAPVALRRRRSASCGGLMRRHRSLCTRHIGTALYPTSQSAPFCAGTSPGALGVSTRAPAPVRVPPRATRPYRLPWQPAAHAQSHTHAGVGRLVGRSRLHLSTGRQFLGCTQSLAGAVCLD